MDRDINNNMSRDRDIDNRNNIFSEDAKMLKEIAKNIDDTITELMLNDK